MKNRVIIKLDPQEKLVFKNFIQEVEHALQASSGTEPIIEEQEDKEILESLKLRIIDLMGEE